jgi:hypothetical protein
MTYNFLFIIILIFILLIGLDAVLFWLRREDHLRGGLQFPISRRILERIKTWFKKSQPAAPPPTPPAATSPKVSKTISIGSSRKPSYIEISGDVPEGTTVQFTIKVVNSKGKVITKKGSLTHETAQSQKSLKAASAGKKVPKTESRVESAPGTTGVRQFMLDLQKHWLVQTLSSGFRVENLGSTLLVAAIAIYAFAISFKIDSFPIYFFTDEAIHMNLVADFIRDGFRNYSKEFMPTFFIVEGWVNGTSVYVQVLPYLLFGKSIITTRLVSAFFTLLAAAALGLFLKQVFKIKYYWAGVFLLLTTPAWFFHARTAFEYAEVGSFYMIFLYFYSRYRDGHLSSLYAALIAGALSFYTHGLGQVLMTITGLALFIVDFRYHIHPDRRKTVLWALLLGALLLLPFARYFFAHSGEAAAQIKRRASYWYDGELTVLQKVMEFMSQYAGGLNPLYWYSHNLIDLSGHYARQFPGGWSISLPFGLRHVDIERHVMKGYGNGLWFTLPFALIGFIRAVRGWREFSNRVVLIAFLAAPLPASIVAIGMPRMLWMSIPMAILTTLGLSACLEKLELYWHKASASTWLPVMTFTMLASLSIFLLRDALVNGPLWFDDYGLYGMQYGAKQVFADTIVPGLKEDPDRTFIVSPSWANGTDEFMDFFIPPDMRPRVNFGQPVDRLKDPAGFAPGVRFIVPYNEYDNLLLNPKFTDLRVHKIIPYPNGKPGFYVMSLQPADNIAELLEAERLKNITPVEESVQIGDQLVRVLHSPFDSGGLIHIFDQDPDTLARVLTANPFVFDINPPTPINTNSVLIQTGSLPNFTITISLYAPGSDTPEIYQNTYEGLPADPLVTIPFDKGPATSARIYIEIKDNVSGQSSQIHVRTIEIK